MRYVLDHDFHVHTQLSHCSSDPEQNPTRILQYAKDNNLKTVITTDHYWDERIHSETGSHGIDTSTALSWGPYPQEDGIRMLLGAEADIDINGVLGIDRKTYETFSFITVSSTHMHLNGFTCRGDETLEERIDMFIRRWEIILDTDIPHNRTGISHLTAPHAFPEGDRRELLDHIPTKEFRRLFARSAECGLGIEINTNTFLEDGIILTGDPSLYRPYLLAKEAGCKFYFGSDAHTPAGFTNVKRIAESIIDDLDLKESDKFIPEGS